MRTSREPSRYDPTGLRQNVGCPKCGRHLGALLTDCVCGWDKSSRLNWDTSQETLNQPEDHHHRCFHCGAYFDECQCDGGLPR